MVSGWQTIGGYRYYFNPTTKIMARNTTVDGIRIGKDGRVITARESIFQITNTSGIRLWNTNYTMTASQNAGLNAIISAFSNRGWNVSFVMIDINTGQAITYNPGKSFYSASTIKGPFVMSLLDAGYAPTGNMWNTISWSSNYDYENIRRQYGNSVFKNWLSKAGVAKSQGDSYYTSTSSLDLAKMWLYGYSYFNSSKANSGWARSTFQHTANSPISAKLGGTYTVYSKAGWLADGGYWNVYNDAGIVLAGKNPYILAVMSGSPEMAGAAQMQQLVIQLNSIHAAMVK